MLAFFSLFNIRTKTKKDKNPQLENFAKYRKRWFHSSFFKQNGEILQSMRRRNLCFFFASLVKSLVKSESETDQNAEKNIKMPTMQKENKPYDGLSMREKWTVESAL